MEKKYEYHKQNDYPGERVAEKKRVSERAETTNARSGAWPIIVAALLLLIVGLGLGYMNLQQQAKIDSLKMQLAKSDNLQGAVTPVSGAILFAADTARPFVVQVSPANNESTVGTHDAVTVWFNEPMDANTINGYTVVVKQRTTPEVGSPSLDYRSMQLEGVVIYNGLAATFTPKKSDSFNPMQPSQEYGNVFTVTITTGAKDIAGNSLAEDYVWSFTTGNGKFNTGATTSQTG